MLSERPWKLESVVALLSAFLFAMVFASLVSLGLNYLIPGRRFVQFVINTFCFQGLGILLLQFFLSYYDVGWREFLGLNKIRWRIVARALVTSILILPIALGLNSLSATLLTKINVAPVEQISMQALQVTVTLGQRIVFGIGAILLAPIVEESFFRGIFYPTIKQLGYPRVALFGSSLLFALIHFNLMTFVPLVVLGLVLVWLLETTDTLIAPIVAHACFNGANFIIYLNESEISRWWDGLIRAVRPVEACALFT
jgi:membrane protease YdiL (CAAX protease family)